MAEKSSMARAGTMDVTAKEGTSYLDRNLTEWKKPHLIDEFEPPKKTPKLSKHTTMKGTAKEAEVLFKGTGRPDQDAFTRGQNKMIAEITKPKSKKAKMGRAGTMAGTKKEAKDLLAGEKLSDTRQETNRKLSAGKKGRKRSRADNVTNEAKAVYSDLDTSGPRKLRKRKAAAPKPAKAPKTKAVKKSKPSPKKPTMKKAGTMVATAKEGRNLLKIAKKTKYFTK